VYSYHERCNCREVEWLIRLIFNCLGDLFVSCLPIAEILARPSDKSRSDIHICFWESAGNPLDHHKALSNKAKLTPSGEPSLQNSLEMARASLSLVSHFSFFQQEFKIKKKSLTAFSNTVCFLTTIILIF
jgi:hypothetical protein